MIRLIARSREGDEWYNDLKQGEQVLIGRDKQLGLWSTPWDAQISREHFQATWTGNKLHVKCLPERRNPTFYKDQKVEDFEVSLGEVFTIGKTLFSVIETDSEMQMLGSATPLEEMTCGVEELRQFRFIDADQRIEVLASLPEVIRFAGTDEELELKVVEVLLKGIPNATAAAIVRLHGAAQNCRVELRASQTEGNSQVPPRISRRLVIDAIQNRRQSVWYQFADDDPDQESGVARDEIQWGICAPLPDEPEPGFGVYITGKSPAMNSRREEGRRKGDLKFAELTADLYGALRQSKHFQTQAKVLSKSFSPRVIEAIRSGNIDEVLKRKEVEATVLFCDLRGSCLVAEEGQHDLSALWDRIRAALGVMTGAIMDQQGVIGDFQGDAAMGFWGWPLGDDQREDDQVLKACRAALSIQRQFAGFAQDKQHPLANFACGIGIATGPAIAGRLGTMDQFKVGVFGPTVNLAARLESMTKFWKVSILLNDMAAERLQNVRLDGIRVRRVVTLQPYGMEKVTTISELLPPNESNEGVLRTYDAALQAFSTGKWDQALELLKRLRTDGPSQVLRSYIENHGKPPVDWNGVLKLTSK